MYSQFHLPNLELNLPLVNKTALASVAVADYRNSLFDEELSYFSELGSVERQQEFSSGRHCVRVCQDLLDHPRRPVPRDQRRPIWQTGLSGSISHTKAVAVAMLSGYYRSVGLDIEAKDRMGPATPDNLLSRLFTPNEISTLRHSELDNPWTLAFSAKEAGYKAIYPLGRSYIGFQEVEVILLPEQRFSFRYCGDNPINRELEGGQGYWAIFGEHVLTVFTL